MKQMRTMLMVMFIAFSYVCYTSPVVIVYSNSNVDAETATKITGLVFKGIGLIFKGVGSIFEATGNLFVRQAPYEYIPVTERWQDEQRYEKQMNLKDLKVPIVIIGTITAGYITYRLLSSQSDDNDESMEKQL